VSVRCAAYLAITVMAEGSKTGGGEPGSGEGDLLAERRARRAAESPEGAVVRRAEAAEATMRTLETHVSSLQQRLGDLEDEKMRLFALLDAERSTPETSTATGEVRTGASPESRPGPPSQPLLEQELRRVKQREYAEQQLRVEAESRWLELDRRSRAEIERLSARLIASERDGAKLVEELERTRQALAEAEQAAVSERAGILDAERSLQARLEDLERRAGEIHRELDAERAARERSERLLESMRRGHHVLEAMVGELRDVVGRLASVAQQQAGRSAGPVPLAQPPAKPAPSAPSPTAAAPALLRTPPTAGAASQERSSEMADALAQAVERLRARVEVAAEAEAGEAEEKRPAAVVQAVAATGSMSPPQEPLLPGGRMSRWAAWRARRRARRAR